MDVKQYDKRPLTVEAFRFDEAAANDPQFHRGNPREVLFRGITLSRPSSESSWFVYNPGRSEHPDGPWQRVDDGDYVIVAPTGCRYPVQADQFERNYAEAAPEPVE